MSMMLRRRMMERGAVIPVYATVTGNPATFTTRRVAPLQGLVVSIIPMQSGSGDPTPNNVRPISGYSSIDVYHAGADLTDFSTIIKAVPSTPGTVYYGKLDLLTGVLTSEWTYQNMGSLSWTRNTSGTYPYFQSNMGAYPVMASGQLVLIGDHYTGITNRSAASFRGANNNYKMCINSSSGTSARYVMVQDSDYTDAAAFKTAVTGWYILYKRQTPSTYQLTPEQVDALLGTNNIWANTGDVTVTYQSN